MAERTNSNGHAPISRLQATIGLIIAIAAPSATLGIMHWRVAEVERRMNTMEQNIKWQNDMLWEMRSDLRVLRSDTKP